MRVQGDNFGNDIVFKHQIHNKVYTYPSHVHQFAELIYMLDGEITITVDGKAQKLSTGSAALIFPFQTHKFFSEKAVKSAMYLFPASLLPSFFISNSGLVGSSAVFVPSEATLSHHKEKILTENDLSLCSVKAFLYLSVTDFLSQNKLVSGFSDTTVAAKVSTYMNQHFSEKISIKSVAQAVGYSPNYLSHCIQKIFNLNFCSLLACLRVDKARKLLVETNKSCIEICYECGFNSERTFHRQFKSITGKTASEYRDSYYCESIQRPKIEHYVSVH